MNTSDTYSVIVTDSNGCTREGAYNVNVSQQDLLSAYTILAIEEVELEDENTVLNGGVGVFEFGGEAEIDDWSVVSGPTTFVKADQVDVSGG